MFMAEPPTEFLGRQPPPTRFTARLLFDGRFGVHGQAGGKGVRVWVGSPIAYPQQ